VKAIASRLKELLAQIAIDIKVEIIEMEIMPDHVQMLVEVDPQFGIHRVVKRFKGATSRYLRLEFPELKSRLPTLWTNSYFVSTVGGAPLEVVKMYIQNQKET
jgi:putative transposase